MRNERANGKHCRELTTLSDNVDFFLRSHYCKVQIHRPKIVQKLQSRCRNHRYISVQSQSRCFLAQKSCQCNGIYCLEVQAGNSGFSWSAAER